MTIMKTILAAALCAAGMMTGIVNAQVAGAPPSNPFKDAVKVWHFADAAGLKAEGAAKTGVKLAGAEKAASLARGGDGLAAEFDGGWLQIGEGSDDGLGLQITDSMTICARVKAAGEHLEGSIFTRWIRDPEMAIDLSAWYMRWGDLGRWNLGFAASKGHNSGHCDGGHLRLEGGDHQGWHDIVIRIDKNRIEDFGSRGKQPTADIFVDGVLRRRSYTAGKAGWVKQQIFLHDEPGAKIGAEPGGRAPFKGLMDHVALWSRALTDEEVKQLSGGILHPEPVQVHPLGEPKFGGDLLPDNMPQAERCRILDEKRPVALKDMRENQPWFPHYHIALPDVVMNTHGICHKGRHHMFPITETLGKMYISGSDEHYYQHLVSEDLVYWKLMPLPIRDSFFPNGTFVHRQDGSVAVIAGPRMQMATSTDDDLAIWKIEEKNPRIVKNIPGGFRMRDSGIFRHDGRWYMATQGMPMTDEHRLLLYTSDDLMEWSYVGVLLDKWGGEGAQVLPFKNKLVIFGNDRGYVVGTFEKGQFRQEAAGQVRYGSGRKVQYPVLNERGEFTVLWDNFHSQHMMSAAKEDTKRGFSGAYGLPLQIELRKDNTIAFNPIDGIKVLRGKHAVMEPVELADGDQKRIHEASGGGLEIIAAFEDVKGMAGVYFEQGGHRAEIGYNQKENTIELNLRNMPYLPIYWDKVLVSAPLPPVEGKGPVTLRVFYDQSLVEIFADGVRIMDWTLFENPSEVKAGVFARGGSARLKELDAWEMGTIWK